MRGGVIVGIHRQLDGQDSDEVSYSIVVPDPGGGSERVTVQVASRHALRLRLGLPVPIRTDGKKAVLDWAALCARWGVDPGDVVQRAQRKDRPDGIVDRAVDLRTERRLAKRPRTTGTITGLRRVTILGMASSNWDIDLLLADGTSARSPKDSVPVYAKWIAAPGSVVPVAVDPAQADKAAIDWVAAAARSRHLGGARRRATAGQRGRGRQRPRIGCRAPVGLGRRTHGLGVLPPARSDPTLESWVAMVRSGHMKPKAFHQAVADWESAGMCTPRRPRPPAGPSSRGPRSAELVERRRHRSVQAPGGGRGAHAPPEQVLAVHRQHRCHRRQLHQVLRAEGVGLARGEHEVRRQAATAARSISG